MVCLSKCLELDVNGRQKPTICNILTKTNNRVGRELRETMRIIHYRVPCVRKRVVNYNHRDTGDSRVCHDSPRILVRSMFCGCVLICALLFDVISTCPAPLLSSPAQISVLPTTYFAYAPGFGSSAAICILFLHLKPGLWTTTVHQRVLSGKHHSPVIGQLTSTLYLLPQVK